MKSLKYFLIIVLSSVWVSSFAQLDNTLNLSADTNNAKITYQDYLKLQEAYKRGEITKAKLEKAFNQLADQLDEVCNPTPKKLIKSKETLSKVSKVETKTDTAVIIVKKQGEMNKELVASN